MEITDKDFWTAFWDGAKLPQTMDYSFKNDRVIAQSIKAYVPHGGGKKFAAEVGCAPGKWLVFLSKEMGYIPHGYEYLESGVEAARKNLELCGVKEFKVIAADFLAITPPQKYSLVVSLGFIEHFTDADAVFAKHAEFISSGGYLALGLPRFKGINLFFQRIVDKYLALKTLPGHNLAVMEPQVFCRLAQEFGMETIFAGYVGGFEPALFNFNAVKNPFVRLALKLASRACSVLFGAVNSKFTSSYIMAVFRKS
ncbi:MAG: methyltransferase domain-containing protein [Elusimicrobia bacterium]|nr:methyltransferase domain-containing protein [Elusimicrobiota bacterium]